MSRATLTFGRFNPPTEAGHGKLISAVQKHAEESGGSHYIFPSRTQDKKKNPLTHEEKVGAMRKLFPKANVVSHEGVRTAIDAMKHLESKGHTHVTMVVGSDRVAEFQGLLTKYRKKEFPKIKKVEVRSAGQRDPDAEGAEGMSASKLRGLVSAGKRDEFVSHYSDPKLGAHIHDRVKAGMQMESVNPVGIFLIGGPGSGKDYLLSNIFSRFDLTEVQIDHLLNGSADELLEQGKNIVINGAADADKIAVVSALLENYELDYVYVSVTNKVSRLRNGLRENPLAESKRVEKWLKAEKLAESFQCFRFNNSINLNESSDFEKVFFADQIEKLLGRLIEHGLELQEVTEAKTFAPVPKHKSGLPKKYTSKLSPSTIAARKAHFKKMSKKSDKDPTAYKPAPGDATAKTRLSKYTKKYRAMYGEQVEADVKPTHSVEEIAAKHGVSQADIIQALAIGKQVEKEHTNDETTAEKIALAHLWEKPDYYTQLAKMEQFTGDAHAELARYSGPKVANKLRRKREVEHFRDVHRREREAHRIAVAKEEVELVDEGAADKSLAAKAEKSGVPLRTLKAVFRRGVAAWKTGHRPGTTPSQWGHARVNSYITKGKTYHTADKDLREETKITGTNCANCIHWVKESVKPVDKSELNENGGLKPTSDAYVALAKHADLISLPGKGTVKEKAFCNHEDIQDFVTERMCCAYWDNKDAERPFKGKADVMEMQLIGTDSYRRHAISMTPGQNQKIADAFPVKDVKKEECDCDDCECSEETNEATVDITPKLSPKRKQTGEKPNRAYNARLAGLSVVSNLTIPEETQPGRNILGKLKSVKLQTEEEQLKEAIQYHLTEGISFTENVFRPGSDMFFEMIKEAKKLYKEGKYTPADEYELDMLNSDIGEVAEYDGQLVVLDYPVEEGLEEACWSGYTQKGMKKKGNRMVPNCVPVNEEDETGGKGIGKPWREGGGGAVYVRDGGSIRKVRFSQSGMAKKFNDPARVRSFVARHRCLTNKDRTSASYWACRWPRYFSNSGKIWW